MEGCQEKMDREAAVVLKAARQREGRQGPGTMSARHGLPVALTKLAGHGKGKAALTYKVV